jgi:hypothetical protein
MRSGRLEALPSRHWIGTAGASIYLAALAVINLDLGIHGASLASSPAGVARGALVPLLSSALVIDGPPWPQLALLAIVLFVALPIIGARRLVSAALAAHVGATVLAYTALGLVGIVSASVVRPVVHAPDYGMGSRDLSHAGPELRHCSIRGCHRRPMISPDLPTDRLVVAGAAGRLCVRAPRGRAGASC